MSFKKIFFKNLLISGGYLYLSQIFIFIASFATSRLLLPADFGLIGLITIFSGFINIFSDSGITIAVIRTSYQGTFYRGLNAISIIIGLLLCVLTLLLIYPISIFFKNPEIILPGIAISFLFVARSVIIVPMAQLQKSLQFARYGKILLASTVAATIGTITMAYFGFKYWSLVWSQYISVIVSIVLFYKYFTKKNLFVSKPAFIQTFKMAKKLIGSLTGFNIITYWSRNSDNLIVGKFYGAGDLGIYNRAYLMLQLPLNLIAGLFTSVLFPSLTRYKNEGGNVEQEYFFVLKIIALLNLPVSIILIIFPNSFVNILWGKNWMLVANLLPYFGLLIMVQTLLYPLGSMLLLEKKERTLMILGWVGSALMIACIIYGSTISLTAIAAFYSLGNLVFVLPVNVLYGMKHSLGYSGVISFWFPKIITGLIIWVAIYNHLNNLILVGLLIWIAITLLNVRQPIIKLYNLLSGYRVNSKLT